MDSTISFYYITDIQTWLIFWVSNEEGIYKENTVENG